MAEEKKAVKEITSMDQDFAQWYTDVVRKAELCDYTSVKGCMVIQPAGYAIWERIQSLLDRRFKATGVKNCYMPLFIPESLLDKEKDHVEGFAPEVAWVTQGGLEPLQERLCVRPTSETLFCDYYAKNVHPYRDLPQVLNQWCSVVRWEKTTRPFLRSREFLWQEGHTVHATAEEAQERTEQMLNLYADFCEQELAIPVVRGQKTDKEKFAGAVATYTIESLMHDGMQFQDKDNSLKYMHQTSWGMTTRMIGALIMVHGDDSGLKMPPHIAPIQVTIVPVAMHKEGVLERAKALAAELEAAGVRVNVDDTDRRPGFKFAARPANGEKSEAPLDGIAVTVTDMLETIQKAMYERAKEHRDTHTYDVKSMEEFAETVKNRPGFVRAMWCGDRACEDKIKEEVGATSRCIPFAQETISETCVCCGKPAKKMVYWGIAY